MEYSLEKVSFELNNFYQTLKNYRQKYNLKKTNSSLQTMMLLISQTCNMRCSYCYADAGTFGQSSPSTMSLDNAIKALELANKVGIRNIQFFGGEPLLKFDYIKEIVSYGEKKGFNFNYGIITNGTLIDDNIAYFCAQHKISVSVSIDGPSKIHNLCRQYPDGNGTFDDVLKGINYLNSRCVPLTLEIVYDKRYSNIATIKDILSFLIPYCKSYNIGHVVPKGSFFSQNDILKEEQVAKLLIDEIDYIFDSAEHKIPIIEVTIYNILRNLFSNKHLKKRYICESLASRLTVFAIGDIFLCQFTNQPENCLGNIKNINLNRLYNNREHVLEKFTSERLNTWWSNLSNFCIALLEKNEKGYYHLRYPKAYNEFWEHLLYRISTTDIDSFFETWGGYLEPKTSSKKTS